MGPDTVKILLVDDISENLMALEALLQQPGVEIFSVNHATPALDLLRQHDFALAVIDVQMPEIDGFELGELMRSTDRTRHIPIVFVAAGSVETGYAFKGYECGAIDFMYKPLDNHTVKRKVGIFIDLYRQRMELNRQVNALQHAREEQQRVVEELQKTQAELQQAMHLRDEFMSVVSHELRTPLNTLKLELYTRRQHLENGDEDAFTMEKIQQMVASDERQLNRLVRLINDMTDVSRIRTNQLSIRPVYLNLEALVKNLLDQFSALIENASSEVRLHLRKADISAYVDEFRIEQALINLLTNAIRHCARQPIDIHMDDADEYIRISIQDYGKGIEIEDQRRIFERFERGHNERKGSGLGLGLFIANQIVVAHGGTLAVDSRPGEGATFSIVLPKQFAFQAPG